MKEPAETPHAGPLSRFFYSQRLKLHYVDWGNPEAPPLILQHGGQDHCRSWDWVASHLCRDWHIIAPDLRGHGDSEWSSGSYTSASFIADFAELIDHLKLAPVTVVAHSLGGSIALRYSGIYPETVRKLAVIEGVFYGPSVTEKPLALRMRDWIELQRRFSSRQPRKYGSIEDACKRMREANKRLTTDQARHLTMNGVNQNEDGTYSWKFDNYLNARQPQDVTESDIQSLWQGITCPTLLIYGKESEFKDPVENGRMTYFKNARLELYDRAGHWVHHDRLDDVIVSLKEFL